MARVEMRLSQNFTLAEFRVSEDFPELAHQIEFSYEEILRLTYFARVLLQPIRNDVNMAVTVLSGKRSWELHSAIYRKLNKPVIISDHLFDERPQTKERKAAACDITCDEIQQLHTYAIENKDLFKQVGIYDWGCHLAMPDGTGRYGKVFHGA